MPVLAMGDFNDEPFNRSLTEYALSSVQAAKVLNSRSRFFNLMWPLHGQRLGTHYFDNFANLLDQFLASRPLLERAARLRVDPESVRTEAFPEMVGRGDYPAPRRFGRPSKDFDPTGFSDHYPIAACSTRAEPKRRRGSLASRPTARTADPAGRPRSPGRRRSGSGKSGGCRPRQRRGHDIEHVHAGDARARNVSATWLPANTNARAWSRRGSVAFL